MSLHGYFIQEEKVKRIGTWNNQKNQSLENICFNSKFLRIQHAARSHSYSFFKVCESSIGADWWVGTGRYSKKGRRARGGRWFPGRSTVHTPQGGNPITTTYKPTKQLGFMANHPQCVNENIGCNPPSLHWLHSNVNCGPHGTCFTALPRFLRTDPNIRIQNQISNRFLYF